MLENFEKDETKAYFKVEETLPEFMERKKDIECKVAFCTCCNMVLDKVAAKEFKESETRKDYDNTFSLKRKEIAESGFDDDLQDIYGLVSILLTDFEVNDNNMLQVPHHYDSDYDNDEGFTY
ncbi:hypothetical protein VNO77_30466 [Canavalia gladiata]|uniref:Uncharacterized protein n=1 Tax=Canavalia gladiata TaxID=3824 RepID=A0AAN9KNU3_CANGL